MEVNVYARFVTDEFLEPLKKFSRTPEELRFMQAKLVEFLVGNIVNGAACKLNDQEWISPERIYGAGMKRNSPVAEKPSVAVVGRPGED